MVKIDLTPEGLAKGNFLEITVDDKLRDAQAALRDKNLRGALDKIAEALLADPKRLDVLSTYAEIATARGHIDAAVGIGEAAIAHNPDNADAHIMLAQHRLRAGRVADAIAAAGEAARVQPSHTGAHLCLADLLWRENRIPDSVAAYRAAAEAGPIGEPEALKAAARALQSGYSGDARAVTAAVHRAHPASERLAVLHGEACIADGRPGEALSVADTVAPADKAQDLACVRARAELDCGRPARALRVLDGWTGFGARRADVAVLRALALRLCGEVEAARSAYAAAIREAGAVPRLRLGHAVTLRALGLEREALSALDRIDDGADAIASCLNERAAILGRLGHAREAADAAHHAALAGGAGDLTDGPALLDADLEPAMDADGLRAILTNGALSADERIGYEFALGHAEAGRDHHSAAMRAWHSANTHVRDRYSFDVTALTAWLRSVPAVAADWTAGPVREPVTHAPRLVFIVGMPRSGTSLVEQVLAAHPDVRPGGEAHTIAELIGNLARCHPDAGYPGVLPRLGEAELADLRRHVLDLIAARHPGARVVTDKMPGNFAHLGLLARLFPDAVVLACERDPLDTALSIYGQWFRDGHQYAYAMSEIGEVLRAHADVMAAWRGQLGADALVPVTYEALVSTPSATIGHLLSRCGLSHADACFEPWRHPRHVESGSARRVHQPITSARVGRWRTYPEALTPVRARLRREG
jgi:tetratricopeptide (TPR) repeat protein